MKTFYTGIICLLSFAGAAQKNIIISENLASHSEQMDVKLGTQWMGKTFKIRFGEYSIVSSKMGWGKENSTTNFWGNKVKTKSSEKFSFVLTNAAKDSAIVNAVKNVTSKELRDIELLPNLSIGLDAVDEMNKNFTASIQVGNDLNDIWTLVILQSQKGNDEKFSAYLSNSSRKIELRPATSIKEGDKQNLPAKGYEFFENGQSLAALQYLGSGMLGLTKNFAWINKELDNRTKLIFAAAMAAVFQVKGTNPEG